MAEQKEMRFRKTRPIAEFEVWRERVAHVNDGDLMEAIGYGNRSQITVWRGHGVIPTTALLAIKEVVQEYERINGVQPAPVPVECILLIRGTNADHLALIEMQAKALSVAVVDISSVVKG